MSNSLMSTGSSVLEQRAAAACGVISDLKVPLRDLWNPDTCPVKFLPYLAWAFSVDSWDESWSEAEKRSVIGEAFWLHQRKGTVAAIRRVIEKMGYALTLEEWWNVADPAGTFRLEVDINDIGITPLMLDELNRLINDAKPVSRHISRMNIASVTLGPVSVGTSSGCGEIISVYPEEYQPEDNFLYNGVIFHDGNFNYR
ncbi:TPA: phage tail protein I [Raoultella planticola]|uniref:phage tail protein I n=1 Tax=Klebsiella pneumoniae TaxID=573 RepID=UPI000E0EF660|nr:phage tail protein I [Klebsiella pneumoniae]